MEPVTTLLVLTGGSLVGFVIGMAYRGSQGHRQRRVQQELMDRKFKLAESDREAAVVALNRAKSELTSSQESQASAERDLQRSASRIANAVQLEETVTSQSQRIQELEGECQDVLTKSERRSEVYKELTQEHGALEKRWEEAQESISAHEARQDRDAASLSKSKRELATMEASKSTAIAELEGRLESLKPLPAKLEKSEGEARKWRERFEVLEGESGLEIEELRQQLVVLEPLPEEIAGCRDELQVARDLLVETRERAIESETTASKLAQVDSERGEELRTLREEFVDLERTSQELIEDQRGQLEELADLPETVKVREEQLRVNQARLEDLATSTDEELKTLRARVDELSPYPALLAERDEELKTAVSNSEDFEEASSQEINALRARLTELDPVEAELGKHK
ncbi:hypothetical protein CMO84_00420, partial [Candidatus Woesearchaeota archaeon]|nr:hypothetical protein [Candidatus Woesearchaeota archaeon]